MIFLPQKCPICKVMFTPIPPLNLLFFKLPEEERGIGPYAVCTPCMTTLEVKLDEASPGRFDTLLDGNKRIVFRIEAPIPFSRADFQYLKEETDDQTQHQMEFGMEVLPELMKRARRVRPLCKPIPADIIEEDIGCNEAESDSACNPGPESPID